MVIHNTTHQKEEMMNGIRNTIAAMCQQESHGYKTCHYMTMNMHQQHDDGCVSSDHHHRRRTPLHYFDTTSSTSSDTNMDDPDHMDSRKKMVAWCFQVVDFCKFQRETVSIAMNLLDRFMMTSQSQVAKTDVKVYQLAAMTALYTAVKIHEPEVMDPKLISNLSRGVYQPEEVEAMEQLLLTALGWRVNPPTAMSFVRQYLEIMMIPAAGAVDSLTVSRVQDLTQFQTELAIAEYQFLSVKPSVVAYFSLMNALETVGITSIIDHSSSLAQISQSIRTLIGMDQQQQLSSSDSVSQIQDWLYYQAIAKRPGVTGSSVLQTTVHPKGGSEQVPTLNTNKEASSCEISPRSVHVA